MRLLLKRLFGTERAAIMHGLRLSLAAWIAFTLAVLLHVKNPYWAAMPVWVVTQPTRGLLLERGFFRILGTLGGAAFGLALLHVPHLPLVQILVLGLWIALCAAFTHVLRGVHAYGALLCGITGAVVVLPSVLDPAQTLGIAVSRIECTIIGVLVVTFVASWFTPDSEREVFYRRVRRLAADAMGFAADTLRGATPATIERQLLAEINEVESSASLVSAGSFDGYRRLRHVHALVYASVELMAASRAFDDAQQKGALADKLKTLADSVRQATPDKTPRPEWTTAIDAANLTSERLARALNQLMAAELALFTDPEGSDVSSFGRKFVYLAPHYSWRGAFKVGLICGLSTVSTAIVTCFCGWHAGVLTALGVSIFSMILSLAPLPHLLAPKMTAGVVTGVALATAYRFWIQPHLYNPWLLLLSVVPFFLIGGRARVSPLLAVAALEANMCFLLASQAGQPAASPSAILSGSAALILGSVIVTAVIVLAAKRPAERAREVAQEVCRDLETLLTSHQPTRTVWNPQAARSILRLILHLGRASDLGDAAPQDLLSATNLGHAIVDLQKLRDDPDPSPDARHKVVNCLSCLARF